jgi:hypothetical protein
MLHRILLAFLLFSCVRLWAQDEEERIFVASCSLSVKTTLYTPDPGDVFGKAMIEATLCDRNGIPIPDQEIKMTSTCGKLSCLSLDNIGTVSSKYSCFISGPDGKIQVYLLDIPFNKTGFIKASCTYGEMKVHASSNFLITRKIIKKGNRGKSTSSTRVSAQ